MDDLRRKSFTFFSRFVFLVGHDLSNNILICSVSHVLRIVSYPVIDSLF